MLRSGLRNKMSDPITSNKKLSDYCLLVAKGFCMGNADVIPGISGGTIALLLGIYEDFIESIKSFDEKFIKRLLTGKWGEAFDNVAWKYLGSILCGIGLAVVGLSKVIIWLLNNKPIFINSFFFGLIFATIFVMKRLVKRWNLLLIVIAALVFYFTFHLVAMVPLKTPEAPWFIFFSGAIAISAMILPGISGSFILLLLGKYEYVLHAIHERELGTLMIFGSGVILGVVTFVRILSWLFHKFHDLTVVVLIGVVAGSLNKIWPWKETLEFVTSSKGKITPISQINHWPQQFNGEFLLALAIMGLGCFLTLALNASSKTSVLSRK